MSKSNELRTFFKIKVLESDDVEVLKINFDFFLFYLALTFQDL